MKISVRAEWSPLSTPSIERRARREREQVREERPQPVVDGDRPVGAADADVDVQPEGVVPPDDVAEQLVVAAVVRRVDDPLVLPAAPRVRPGRAERDAERPGERPELRPPLPHLLRGLGEALAASGANLHLGGDQLADQVLVHRRARCGRLQVLETVDERERLRVEDRELLLDGERQIGAGLVGSARRLEQLAVRNRLRFTH